jgi:hypothetical protein
MIGQTTISYPLVLLLLGVIVAASFLGYEHVLDGQTIGTLFGAIVTGGTVGHFTTKGNSGE